MSEALPLARCLPPGWELRIEHLPAWGLPDQADHAPEKFFYFLTDKNESPAISARHIAFETVLVGEETNIITRLFAEVRDLGAKQREKQAKKAARARK